MVEWSLPEHEVRKFGRSYLRNGVADRFFSQDHLSRETNNHQASSSLDVAKGGFIERLQGKSSSILSKSARRNSFKAIEQEMNDLDLNLEHLTRREFKK
jgi:hypothetical protein